MEKIVLTDVCDTLIDLNSTYDYIKFLCKHNYGSKSVGFLLTNYCFGLFSFALSKVIRYDIHRNLTFSFFKGIKESDLIKINDDFRKYYISKKTKILDKIIEHKNKGDKVVLVSASINPPIDMLGKYLGVDSFSTILEKEGGFYTGNVISDLLGNKESLFFSKKLDISKYNNISYYTDNLSDIGFISKIQELSKNSKFFLIIKSDKRRQKWINLLSSNNIKNYEFIS